MPQYTSSYTIPDGTVVNSVLDSETNVQSVIVTTVTGQVASATITANPTGTITGLSTDIATQLQRQGANVDFLGVANGLSNATSNAYSQFQTAGATALATGNPPPQESQAIPVNPSVDPEVAYYQQLQAENEQQLVTAPLAEPIDPNSDPEFGNIDAAIAAQQGSGTGLTEPPVLSDEEVNTYLAGIPPAYDGEPVTQESLGGSSTNGITSKLGQTQGQPQTQQATNTQGQLDWRVKLQLAPNANYLYKNKGKEGILYPLVATDGIIFPYTPSIQVSYAAQYDPTTPTHSNYKIFQYNASSVDNISVSCDFTAQDTYEANYLLAVIHFLKSVTKMFYGQDQNPVNGTPPPLCYLTGLGTFQFDNHPLAITGFNYSLPTDVDYIQAGYSANMPGLQNIMTGAQTTPRYGQGISTGGTNPPPTFQRTQLNNPTWVPTRMQIAFSAVPIISRNDISNNFSLADYASGYLLRGSRNKGITGIW